LTFDRLSAYTSQRVAFRGSKLFPTKSEDSASIRLQTVKPYDLDILTLTSKPRQQNARIILAAFRV